MLPPRFMTLASGHKMPSVGIGTSQMAGDRLKEALDFAICIGYRHIDTAAIYGNEKEVGQVIHDRVKSGYVKRKELFITSKVPRLKLVSQRNVKNSALKSLEDLKLKNLDMLLLHNPWPCVVDKNEYGKEVIHFYPFKLPEVWKTLESLCNDGLLSNIGVSNFTADQIGKVLEIQKVPLSNVQLEAHVYYQQNNIRRLCHENNIVVSAYAPLGSPARPDQHISGSCPPTLLRDPVVLEISARYKRTAAQVMLNYLVQCGMVVLPKSNKKERIEENLGCLDWSLSNDDFKAIQGLDRGIKLFEFLYMRGHPDFFEGKEF